MGERLTPSTLWAHFRNKAPKGELSLVEVEGVFRGFNGDRVYGGRRYGVLLDRNDERTPLTLRIPQSLSSQFAGREGEIFTLKGVAFWDIRPEFGKAEVVFEVKEVVGAKVDEVRIDRTALIYEEKAKRGWKDIERMLTEILSEGNMPRIALVVGESAITDEDVLRGMGRAVSFYEIDIERANLTREEDIAQKLRELDRKGYDLIALVRGGGSGLEVFDSVALAKEVLSLQTPFVTALGHAKDLHLLDRIADRYFITPTQLGRFLYEQAERLIERLQLQERIRLLEEENRKLRKEKEKAPSLAYIILVALIVLVLFLILKAVGGK